MMVFVVIVFGVCWLPYHLYFLLASAVPAMTLNPNMQQIYLVIYWIAMSNSMYNPIIYCWMNERYQLFTICIQPFTCNVILRIMPLGNGRK